MRCQAPLPAMRGHYRRCRDGSRRRCRRLPAMSRPLRTSSGRLPAMPAQISATCTQISTMPAQISATPTQIATTPAQISVTPTQISTMSAQISATPRSIATTPTALSAMRAQIATTLGHLAPLSAPHAAAIARLHARPRRAPCARAASPALGSALGVSGFDAQRRAPARTARASAPRAAIVGEMLNDHSDRSGLFGRQSRRPANARRAASRACPR